VVRIAVREEACRAKQLLWTFRGSDKSLASVANAAKFLGCPGRSPVPLRTAESQLLMCLYTQLGWSKNLVQMMKK
jgi:hypothetical protein